MSTWYASTIKLPCDIRICRRNVWLCTWATFLHEDLWIDGLVCSYSYLLYQIFVTSFVYIEGVFTWSQVFEHEYTIVVVVGSIVVLVREFTFYVVVAVGLDHLVCFVAENDLSAVEWQILVVRTSIRDIVLVAEFLSLRANITHDITYFLSSFAIVILDTTEVANTLLAAPLWAQCTVTSRAISVEVTL